VSLAHDITLLVSVRVRMRGPAAVQTNSSTQSTPACAAGAPAPTFAYLEQLSG
jgi:hypothetical protein